MGQGAGFQGGTGEATGQRMTCAGQELRDVGMPGSHAAEVLLSVIVATRNRTAALRDICLAALARQEIDVPRELIICDATDDRTTEELIGRWAAAHPEWRTIYLRADRAGTCSQRNQAVAAAQGEIVLFLDDDLELLPGALDELVSAFRRDGGREYAGFECTFVAPVEPASCLRHGPLRQAVWRGTMHLFGLPTGTGKPVVLPSGFPDGTEPEPAGSGPGLLGQAGTIGDVEWLGGCCMAFRRDLIIRDSAVFDTKLERFSGYALAEDNLLCVMVRRQTGLKLGQCRAALGVHHAVPGGRGDERARGAALAYNIFLVWSADGPPTAWRWFQYLRGQLGQVVISFRHGGWQRFRGLLEGWRAVSQEVRRPETMASRDGML